MRKQYTILKIYEDDFGCEERLDGYDPQVIVMLTDSYGKEMSVKQSDAWMYEHELDEGDTVLLEDGKLINYMG